MLNENNSIPLNVVVTAASSALGRETVRQLVARGHVVTGCTQGADGATMVRQDGGLPAYPDLLRAGEIKSILQMAKADVVVNLAPQLANILPTRNIPWEENERLLTEGTAALLQAVEGTTVKSIIHTSTTRVYGDAHGEWVDETRTTSRDAALRATAQAEKDLLGSSVHTTVLRAGIVYGGDAGTQELSEAIHRGRTVFLGDAHAYQNWVYVADLARAVVLATEQQPAGEIFNITDNTPISAVEFAGYLAGGIGLPLPNNSASTPEFARRLSVLPIQETLLNASVRARNDKAKQGLGWTPRYGDYKAGIEQTLLLQRSERVVQ
jgi:2-alkyl-3-oxoalkanoate reductase